MKKKWYEYLWIASLIYLVLGFLNILFAWLGLLCFFLPLMISVTAGTKAYCNRYCGRGQLFGLLGGRFGLSRRRDIPKWMRSKAFRYGFLIFFFAMFFLMLWNTKCWKSAQQANQSPWLFTKCCKGGLALLPTNGFAFPALSANAV